MEGVLACFTDTAMELAQSPGHVGPSILWQMMGAVMNAIETTPFEYYRVKHAFVLPNDSSPVVMIGFNHGCGPDALTTKQVRYRYVILSKLKERLSDFLNGYFARDNDIKVVYTKNFFYNETA